MKKASTVIISFLLLVLTNISAAQIIDKYVGTWGLSSTSEDPLILISKENDLYKISFYAKFDIEASQTWSANSSNNVLLGSNGSSISALTNGHLELKNFNLEGQDQTILYKIKVSHFYGVWKAASSDKEYIKIFMEPSQFVKCPNAKSFKLFLAKFRENDSPYDNQDLCGSDLLLQNGDVSIKYVSNGKIIVNWKGESIANKVYYRDSPNFLNQSAGNNDLTTFWRNFKKSALSNDYRKIEGVTYFPFLKQDNNVNQEEFKSFRFPDYVTKSLVNSKAPIKSSMMIQGFNSGSLYQANCGGATLCFSNINGQWKFVAILYGE